jgi:hypothetical protein
MPSPIGVANLVAGLPHAASNSFGSLYLSSRTMMAQAILAILLASATAATFVGRRSAALASKRTTDFAIGLCFEFRNQILNFGAYSPDRDKYLGGVVTRIVQNSSQPSADTRSSIRMIGQN